MGTDRGVRALLAVIAAALLYLCVVLTPLPALRGQQPTPRPGEPSGPVEVVLVGWRTDLAALPVVMDAPVRVEGPVTVQGAVLAEPGSRLARVVLAGWEERAAPGVAGTFRPLTAGEAGLPVASAGPGRLQ